MLVSQGDEQAFTLLFHTWHHRLGAYIYRLTRSLPLTEEIVQDVFLKIWLNRRALWEVERFGPYLYVISRNHALNSLRQIARERRQQSDWQEHLLTSAGTAGEDSHHYFNILIQAAVDQLPSQQQKVYLLSRQEGLSYKEIAERLQIAPETVKRHMKLALRAITAYIQANRDILLLILLTPLAVA